MSPFEIGGAHLRHPLRIVSKGPVDDLRILPVVGDITDRGKRHIASDGRSFFVGKFSQVVSILFIPSGANFDSKSDISSVCTGSVPALFRIAGDKDWNLCVFLQDPVLFLDGSPRRRVVPASS